MDRWYGYTLIMRVSAAEADDRTLRIGCSDYVITTATKIQFPVVIWVKCRLIPRNMRYIYLFQLDIILLLSNYDDFRMFHSPA